MATQAALIAETVAGMRRAVANYHDSKSTTPPFKTHNIEAHGMSL